MEKHNLQGVRNLPKINTMAGYLAIGDRMNKITKILIFIAVFGAILGLSQLVYLSQMTPMVREMYSNVGEYTRTGQWTLDTTKTAQKYFSNGMSKADALTVMQRENCKLSSYPTPRSEVSCYRRIKGAFMGIRLPFFNTYKIVIILDTEDDKVRDIKSVINLETVYG